MKNTMKNLLLMAFTLFIGMLPVSSIFGQGNVGIGTTNPDGNAILDLTSTNQGLLMPRLDNSQESVLSGAEEGMVFYNTATNTFRYNNGVGLRNVGFWSSVVSSNDVYFNEGNVGINMSNPSGLLHIRKSVAVGVNPFIVQDASSNDIFVVNNSDNVGIRQNFSDVDFTIKGKVGNVYSLLIRDGDNNSDFIVHSNGQVYLGGGTDASVSDGTLSIGGGLFIDNNEIVTTSAFFINAIDSGTSAGVDICGNGATTTLGGDLRIENRIRGGDNPTNFNSTGIQIGMLSGLKQAAYLRNNSAPDGGGESIPTVRIENQGNGIALYIETGDAIKPGGGSWNGQSDRRLKQDITNYSDGLSQVKAINTVTYRYNELADASPDDTYVGIIAQELQEIAPHMVKQKGEYLMVDPSAFTYMLINAVQEQDQIITDQNKKIEDLEARLARIEAMLKK
ncbi:MAG: hypothetical protein ACI85O_002971 [Saprospiraceae bacterium]|jgi:hypothetical protein